MQIFFQSRDKARSFKANSTNQANKQVKDLGKESAKRWAVLITNNRAGLNNMKGEA